MVQKLWRDTISSEWLTCWVIIFHQTRKEAFFKDSIGITFEIQLLLYFLLIFFHILIYECVIFRIVAKVVIHVQGVSKVRSDFFFAKNSLIIKNTVFKT